MGLKPSMSFSTGELDPILHDHVTLEKFKKALDTARNVMIGKTGSILSRFAREHIVAAKNNNEEIQVFSPPNSGRFLEFGPSYVRCYSFDGTLHFEDTTGFGSSVIGLLKFDVSGEYVYVSTPAGTNIVKIQFTGPPRDSLATSTAAAFTVPDAISSITGIASTGTGYNADYAVTGVFNGEESLLKEGGPGAGTSIPINVGEVNTITVQFDLTEIDINDFNEIRVYRRPTGGGAYGLLGTSTYIYQTGPDWFSDFKDLGANADFTNNPPSLITEEGLGGTAIASLQGVVSLHYQQRLLLTVFDEDEAIIASRPGYPNNFYRDYPYDSDSALAFKVGSSGNATILRMIDSDGLIVFTTLGVYVSVGLLSADNLALEKKGNWIINPEIPPLVIPGGVFFVDRDTNSIRNLRFSQDTFTYEASEFSIFSNHLFQERTITSWAFQDGVAPLITVNFSDGTFATFTYNAEQLMRAWTRHDSVYPIEQVEGTSTLDTTLFVVNKNGQRYIEKSLPRKVTAATKVANTEYDKLGFNYLMDASVTTQTLMNDSLVGSDVFTLVPVVADTWNGNLTLTCGTSALFPTPGLGDVGTIFRFFDTTDRTIVDLKVVSRTSDNEVVVKPSATFPSTQATDFRLYETMTQVTGLTHLEGEDVVVVADGAVLASPYNDVEGYSTVTVSSGTITLPNSEIGAIVVVGRPVAADIKTLNISTVEQSPTLIESLTVNKIYVRTYQTRGLYIGNEFPEEKTGSKDGTSVDGMEDMEKFDVPDGYDIIGNRYKQPTSRRIEKTLPGNWDSQGQIAIRQVDPLHFEILSIIPDIEVLRRSNR